MESTQRQLQGDTDALEPGARAREDLLAGNGTRIEGPVSQGLTAKDPAAIASLSGVAARLALQRDPDGADASLGRRAIAVDAALPLVACDLGLDCGATSLSALQLCALQGWCDGDCLRDGRSETVSTPARRTSGKSANGCWRSFAPGGRWERAICCRNGGQLIAHRADRRGR